MRVLLVSQEFPPETGWGGIATYLGVIAPALVRHGAEVHVLSVVEGQVRSDRIVDGVHVHRAPFSVPRGVGRVTRLPQSCRRLSGAVAVAREHHRLGLSFDVCESPEWGAEALVLSLLRLPLVVRLHSSAEQVFRYFDKVGRDRRLLIRMERTLIRRADVVTGTAAQTSTVGPSLGLDPGRVRTITYPVAPVEPLPPADGPPRVVYLGRFEKRKAPEVVVQAVPALLERVPDARVALVGIDGAGGGYLDMLRAMIAELGVGDAVEIVERWGREVVEDELRRATVCAVPSPWESFGYVAAEAATLGRPVVGSNIPALAELIDDGVTGRLVEPNNPQQMAEALADVLSSPDGGREMGAAAARTVAARCDVDAIAEQTLAAYEAAREFRLRGRRASA